MTTIPALVDAFLQAGEMEEALKALNAYLEGAWEDESALRLRAQIYLRLGDAESAAADFAELGTYTVDDLILYSTVLERLGCMARALEIVLSAYHIALDDADARPDSRLAERYVHLLCQQGDYDTAQNVLRDWAGLTPGWSALAGEVAAQRGDFSAALDHYTRAIEALMPQAASNRAIGAMVGGWLCGRAAAHQAMGALDAAMQDYVHADELLPDDPMIALNRALIAAQEGQLDAAQNLIRRAWALAPDALRVMIRAELDADPLYQALLADWNVD